MYGILDNGVVIAYFAAPLQVRSNVPVSVTETLSLKRFTRVKAAQRWEITSAVVPLSHGGHHLMALLVSLDTHGTVQVRFPQNYGVITTRVLSASVPSASAGANSTSVVVSGHTGYIPQGTFVQFDNHSKIYMVKSDLTNNGTLHVFPSIRTALNNTTFKFGDDLSGAFQFDTDVIKGMVYSDGILMDPGNITLLEKV